MHPSAAAMPRRCSSPLPDAHLYRGDTERLMVAAAAATYWPPGHIHFEWFRGTVPSGMANEAFEAELTPAPTCSSATRSVPPNKTTMICVALAKKASRARSLSAAPFDAAFGKIYIQQCPIPASTG